MTVKDLLELTNQKQERLNECKERIRLLNQDFDMSASDTLKLEVLDLIKRYENIIVSTEDSLNELLKKEIYFR